MRPNKMYTESNFLRMAHLLFQSKFSQDARKSTISKFSQLDFQLEKNIHLFIILRH